MAVPNCLVGKDWAGLVLTPEYSDLVNVPGLALTPEYSDLVNVPEREL